MKDIFDWHNPDDNEIVLLYHYSINSVNLKHLSN